MTRVSTELRSHERSARLRLAPRRNPYWRLVCGGSTLAIIAAPALVPGSRAIAPGRGEAGQRLLRTGAGMIKSEGRHAPSLRDDGRQTAQALGIPVRIGAKVARKSRAARFDAGGARHRQAVSRLGTHDESATFLVRQGAVGVALQVCHRHQHEAVLHGRPG